MIPLCKELGIAFVPYSPLGRGFLTGEIKSEADLPELDWRRRNPRFQGENFLKNIQIVDLAREIAAKHDARPWPKLLSPGCSQQVIISIQSQERNA